MRLLLVEDDAAIARGVTAALQGAGFVVDLAQDGETAWAMGGDEDYDAVILDLGLPRLDGLSVLRRWRSDERVFPIIILSARGGWTEKVEGIEAGADDYLAKPFEPGELVARVRALIRRNAGHSESVLSFGAVRWIRDGCRSASTERPCRCRRWNTVCCMRSRIAAAGR